MANKTWGKHDYTNSASYDISLTIYSNERLTSTVDLTAFTTITLRLIDQNGIPRYTTTSGLSGDNAGVLLIKFSSNDAPYLRGLYRVRVRLEDGTNRITAVGWNGSDELFFEDT